MPEIVLNCRESCLQIRNLQKHIKSILRDVWKINIIPINIKLIFILTILSDNIIFALTSNIDSRRLTFNLSGTRPCDTFAFELVSAKIFLDVVSGYVQFAVDYSSAGVRVYEILLLRIFRPRVVAPEVDLQRVCGLAM